MRNGYPSPVFSPDLDRPTTRSLSLLFTLQELLTAFELVEQLQKGGDSSKILKELHSCGIEEAPLAQRGGAMGKLCFYSEILLQASEVSEDNISIIIGEMQSAIFKLMRVRSQEKIMKYLPTFHEELLQKLRNLFQALFPFFLEERTNENVLMVLLEKKESFNYFLGPRTIEELFRSFFPLGIEELRIVLHEGYSRRGFENFYAERESLIDALEWEPPCDPLLQML